MSFQTTDSLLLASVDDIENVALGAALEGPEAAAAGHDPDAAPGHDPTGQSLDDAEGHGPDAAINAPETAARHAPVVAVPRSVSSFGE